MRYKLEEHLNDWVKAQFKKLGLKNQKDYYTESAIPDYLKEALRGRAKTVKSIESNSELESYKLEEHLNDWVKVQFERLGLKNQKDYYTESAIPDYLKEALRGRAKTENKTNFGKPDFSIIKYAQAPVIIENKLGIKNLISESKDGIKFDEKSVQSYAVNGALYYAIGMIA